MKKILGIITILILTSCSDGIKDNKNVHLNVKKDIDHNVLGYINISTLPKHAEVLILVDANENNQGLEHFIYGVFSEGGFKNWSARNGVFGKLDSRVQMSLKSKLGEFNFPTTIPWNATNLEAFVSDINGITYHMVYDPGTHRFWGWVYWVLN